MPACLLLTHAALNGSIPLALLKRLHNTSRNTCQNFRRKKPVLPGLGVFLKLLKNQ